MLLILPLNKARSSANKSRAWMVLALVLICLSTYAYWLQTEKKHLDQAVYYYFSSDLPQIELPLYWNYLGVDADFQLLDPEAQVALFQQMIQDGVFISALKQQLLINSAHPYYHLWLPASEQFHQLLGKSLSFGYGFIPAEPKVASAITSLFIHADFWHLFGNLFFLCWLGLPLTRLIGNANLLIVFLCSGLMGVISFAIFEAQQYTPLLGASAGIAGIIACTMALYGRTRIHFFYNVLFYVGVVRLPAFCLLPIWFMWEAGSFFFSSEQQIAFIAHLGGFIAGALLALVLSQDPRVRAAITRQQKHEQYEQDLAAIKDAIKAVDFVKARKILAESIAHHPDDSELLRLARLVR